MVGGRLRDRLAMRESGVLHPEEAAEPDGVLVASDERRSWKMTLWMYVA